MSIRDKKRESYDPANHLLSIDLLLSKFLRAAIYYETDFSTSNYKILESK
jgi:hypothetical protein